MASDPMAIAYRLLCAKIIPVPIVPGEKRPAFKEWERATHEDALQRISRAMRYYRDNTGATTMNIGALCGSSSNLVIVDIDVKKHGMEKWEELIALHGDPETYVVRTGSGGLHYYFHYRSCITSRVEVVKGFGIDVRGIAGQALAEGSIHPTTGKPYVAEKGSLLDIADLPEWLYDLIKAQ
jgi:hypothetical protein